MVALLTLTDRLIECNDESHVNVIGFGKEEKTGYVIVFDLEIVTSTMHSKVCIVKRKGVTPAGCEECSLVVIEFNNCIAGSILDSSDFGDSLLQLFSWSLCFLISWVSIGIRRNIESYSNLNIHGGVKHDGIH